MNSYHPLGHPPQRLVFGIEGFECRTPMIKPLVEPASHRPLHAVEFDFQSGIPGDLPLPPQPGLQAKVIMNARRYQRPRVFTRAIFGCICCQTHQDGAGEVLKECFDCHPVLLFRIEIRAIRWE